MRHEHAALGVGAERCQRFPQIHAADGHLGRDAGELGDRRRERTQVAHRLRVERRDGLERCRRHPLRRDLQQAGGGGIVARGLDVKDDELARQGHRRRRRRQVCKSRVGSCAGGGVTSPPAPILPRIEAVLMTLAAAVDFRRRQKRVRCAAFGGQRRQARGVQALGVRLEDTGQRLRQ